AVAVSPGATTATDIVLAGTYNPNAATTTADGLYRSINGGGAWSHVSVSGAAMESVSSIVRDPSDNTNMTFFAAVQKHGIFESTDAGASWTAVNTGIVAADITGSGNIQMALQFIAGASTLFAGIVQDSNQVLKNVY